MCTELRRMRDNVSAKPGSLERGQGRTGVAGGVSRARGAGGLVRVPVLQLSGLDAGADAAFQQVYPQGIAGEQAPDDTPGRGLRRDERDPLSARTTPGWQTVGHHRDALVQP